jgi:hypothetical protein
MPRCYFCQTKKCRIVSFGDDDAKIKIDGSNWMEFDHCEWSKIPWFGKMRIKTANTNNSNVKTSEKMTIRWSNSHNMYLDQHNYIIDIEQMFVIGKLTVKGIRMISNSEGTNYYNHWGFDYRLFDCVHQLLAYLKVIKYCRQIGSKMEQRWQPDICNIAFEKYVLTPKIS